MVCVSIPPSNHELPVQLCVGLHDAVTNGLKVEYSKNFGRTCLLLRPDEVLSGIPDAPVLEVAYNALGILFQPHHVRIGGLT